MDVVFNEEADELVMADRDFEKFKSDIKVLAAKDLAVKRYLGRNVLYTCGLLLDSHLHLMCLGFGTATLRTLDVESGERLSVINTVKAQYADSALVRFGKIIVQGGNDSIAFIDEDTEQLIGKFNCEGRVTQICARLGGDQLYFVSIAKEGAFLHQINVTKRTI